ncbi:MAG: hypothetical protein ACPLYF_00180, partial [Fervidobacterium sp.]
VLATLAALIFYSVLTPQTAFATEQSDEIPAGAVTFKTQRSGDRYLLALHFKVPVSEYYKVKAVKVTFEPSGTIPLVVYDEKCLESQKSLFLMGQKPLTTIESSEIEELAPVISIDYPSKIEKDNHVKIEYLIEKEGITSTMLAAASSFDSVDEINFSVAPEGKFIKFCCYCCNPPCCVYCQDPVGTCCCACDNKVANCGEIICPPPPC